MFQNLSAHRYWGQNTSNTYILNIYNSCCSFDPFRLFSMHLGSRWSCDTNTYPASTVDLYCHAALWPQTCCHLVRFTSLSFNQNYHTVLLLVYIGQEEHKVGSGLQTRNTRDPVWRPNHRADLGADLAGWESGGLIVTVCVALPVNQACLAQ